MEKGSWVEVFGQLLVGAGLIFGAVQFMLQRKWQSKQLAAEKLAALRDKPDYANMVRILAWDGYAADFHPERGADASRFVPVRHGQIARLLQQEERPPGEVLAQGDIRILIMVDTFLTELDQIAGFVHSGLFELPDVVIHLGYILDQLAANRLRPANPGSDSDQLLHALYRYIVQWKYLGIARLVDDHAALPR